MREFDWPGALKFFDEDLRVNSKNDHGYPSALLNRGRVLRELGDTEGAEAMYVECLSAKPNTYAM